MKNVRLVSSRRVLALFGLAIATAAVHAKTVYVSQQTGSALAENAVTALYDGEDGYGELLKGGRRLGMGIVFR